MATSVFFNNFGSSQEQSLIEDLVIESIRIYGHDCFYLPRSLINKDNIYGEDSISEYNEQFMIEMYIKNVMGFKGEGDFLSKFNLQVRDQMTFTIAKRVFFDEIGNVRGFDRPREGDLIYFPLNKKVFVVKFVEHEAVFYQLGALQTYDLECELWEYSNEIMNTGLAEIDLLQKKYSFDMSQFAILTQDSFVITDEDGYDLVQEQYNFVTQVGSSFEDNENPVNENLQSEAEAIINFTDSNPFSEGNY
jgi:hypothetical protein